MAKDNLYSGLAGICTKFYDLSIDAKRAADFIDSRINKFGLKDILFIGGFFLVAKELVDKGYNVTVADYTDEMVDEGKKRLPKTRIVKADIRKLPFNQEFDAVLVIGRVFTHMLSNEDVNDALLGIRKSLKPKGILFFDNYEDNKIMKTSYFNKRVQAKKGNIKIIRDSSTELISKKPFIVNWKATYIVTENNKSREFNDEMAHRAFSRQEIKELLEINGFKQLENGNNFDETSFYAIAQK